MASPATRRSASIRFVAGIALGVVIGCALAAVDLWGGPRALGLRPQTLGALCVAAAALTISGAVGWIRSWPEAERAGRALTATLALAVIAALTGGGLFGYYAARRGTSAEICRKAACATTRAERARLLDEGLGPLFPVIDPAHECIDLERERRELVREGACPTVVLDDTPCRCAGQAWSAQSPGRCMSGRRTTCEGRGGGARSLGCMSDHADGRMRCDR